jgi:hypothetical protein
LRGPTARKGRVFALMDARAAGPWQETRQGRQRPRPEGRAGNEETEMVAVLTLLAVTAVFAAEIALIARC